MGAVVSEQGGHLRWIPTIDTKYDVGFHAGDIGQVQISTTAVKGEPCPTCGEPQSMHLQINMGDGSAPIERYLCEACAPAMLRQTSGFSFDVTPPAETDRAEEGAVSDQSEEFATARAWVTLYLSSAHRELREEIGEYLVDATAQTVAQLIEVLVAGIGETFGSRDEWSAHVVDVMRQHGEQGDA